MKKSSKTSSKSTLKKLKEEIELCFSKECYYDAKEFAEKVMKLFPKNSYGYVAYVKVITNNYNKYLKQDELKEVRKTFDIAYELSSKNEKIALKQMFDDYLYDLKEVENLRKIKKDIVSKEFMKNVYNDSLVFINQNLSAALKYGSNGAKIKNGYDAIKGLFFLCLLLYNIINFNYLLILTIPFGIFGIITMYSFVEMNFFGKGKYRLQKNMYQKVVNNASDRLLNIKQEIKKINENLEFLKLQKASSISKIPELFLNDISDLTSNDEKKIADQIFSTFTEKDVVRFSYLLENNTNLNVDEITSFIKEETESKDDELLKYINSKISEKKSNQNEATFMKKIKSLNVVELVVAMVISVFSIIVLINNFNEINVNAFIFAVVTGVLSMLIYNIDTGKHASFNDTFGDNLLSTVFNATLVYDLVYYKTTNELPVMYGFVQVPIIFVLVFIGFVMLISLLKYNYLLKKLRS